MKISGQAKKCAINGVGRKTKRLYAFIFYQKEMCLLFWSNSHQSLQRNSILAIIKIRKPLHIKKRMLLNKYTALTGRLNWNTLRVLFFPVDQICRIYKKKGMLKIYTTTSFYIFWRTKPQMWMQKKKNNTRFKDW